MNVPRYMLVFVVLCYRWFISPAKAVLFGPAGRCRFEPSCSAYALEALREHGALAGSWLALKRVGRCHPWGACGPDPVPRSGRLQERPLKPATNLTGLKTSPAAPNLRSAAARH